MEKRYDVPELLPGEELLLKEITITQGILIILIFAMFVFITESIYIKFIEYFLIIWYISLWFIRALREKR